MTEIRDHYGTLLRADASSEEQAIEEIIEESRRAEIPDVRNPQTDDPPGGR